MKRVKQDSAKFQWDPIVTSTPLKTNVNDQNYVNGLCKEPVKNHQAIVAFFQKYYKECQNVPKQLGHVNSKRPRKYVSSAVFDNSSSSDEEIGSAKQKRPIIKLTSGKSTRSFLKNKAECDKNSERESGSEKNVLVKSNTFTKEESNSIEVSQKKNFKSSEIKTSQVSSVKRTRSYSQGREKNKRLVENNSNKENHLKYTQECKNNNNNNLKSVKASGKIPKYVGRKKNTKIVTTSSSKAAIEKVIGQESTKTLKKNNSEDANKLANYEMHNRSIISNQKNSFVEVKEINSNNSHKLFSESREEETRNSLNLTAETSGESVGNSIEKSETSSNNIFSSLHPANSQASVDATGKKVKASSEKIKRQKIVNTVSDVKEQNKNHNTCDSKWKSLDSYKNSKLPKETISTNNSLTKKVLIKNHRIHTKQNSRKDLNNKETVNVSKQSLKSLETVEVNLLEAVAQQKVKSKAPAAGSKTEEAQTVKPVFKFLNDMSFLDNDAGCSVGQSWNLGNFKCGVFKVKANSVLEWKTSHLNSHLGGVLVRGHLKMKIGHIESDLKEGDMACVPPLTDWQATNIGDQEAVFYYWCGKFKS